MRSSRVTAGLCAAALFAMLAGCGATAPLTASSRPDKSGAPAQPAFSQFSDIPVPAGANMDLERSLVLGEAEFWIGRLVMSTSEPAGRMYDFYFREMPRFHWSPVTSVRAETSVLTYTKGGRVATIQIRNRTIGGATVSMTISPRGKPVRTAPPAPAAGAGGPVRMAPLR